MQNRPILHRDATINFNTPNRYVVIVFLWRSYYFSVQIVTMGLFRTIALFYLGSFDSIVRRCMIQREQSKAADKRE